MYAFLKKYFFRILSLILVLLILTPYIFQDGYFLSIDWVFGPEILPVQGQYYPNYILWIYLAKFISLLFGTVFTQKLIFIFFFLLALISSRTLLHSFDFSGWIVFFLSFFFILNPFVYGRLMQGQIYILYAYALFPLFIYYLFASKYFLLGLFSGLILSFSPHFVFVLGFVFCMYFLFFSKKISRKIFATILIAFLFNLYWIPFIFSDTNILRFNLDDFSFFQSSLHYTNNIYMEILSLNGFRGDAHGRYYTIVGYMSYIRLFFLLLISVLGFFSMRKSLNDSKYSVFLLFLFIFAFIFSLGISQNNIFISLNSYLFEYLPFYEGIRETNKWSVVLVIVYLIFFAKGIKFLFQDLKDFKYLLLLTLFLFVFISPSSIPLFFSNKLYSYNYPEEWKILKLNFFSKKRYKTISFPWHQSLGFSFTRGLVVNNPTGVYFGSGFIVPDNIEFGKTYSQSERQESLVVEKYFSPQGLFKTSYTEQNIESFFDELRANSIDSILLFHTADFNFYKQIFSYAEQKGILKLIFFGSSISYYVFVV